MKKTLLFLVLSLLISFSVKTQTAPDLTIDNPAVGQTYIANVESGSLSISGLSTTCCLSVFIDGPSYMTWKESAKTFTAEVSGGTGPYTYQWFRRALGTTYWENLPYTSSSIQQGGGVESFELKCSVTSSCSCPTAEATHTVSHDIEP